MENTNVKIISDEILSDNWYVLRKVKFTRQLNDGKWLEQTREAYDRGNGATIMLYNPTQKTVILTSQFRLPTFINGNPSGMLIEACAGLLDEENPEECIRRETEEETGYKISDVRKIFELYMSPGSVTEILHFFVAEYSKDMKVNAGGGAEEEQEHIEVLEIPFKKALTMVRTGEIKDAKTVILLQYLELNGLVKI
jgi:nudix-type nucleoside diphosphatase (YffH/AdpP family)